MKRIALFLLVCLFFPLGFLSAETTPPATPFAEAVKASERGDTETARMLLEVILAKDPGNKSAQAYLKRIAAQSDANQVLQKQMKAIILPTVNLQDVAAREAFLYVSQQVEKQTEGKTHLNVVWLAAPEAGNRITLSLQKIPVSEVLHYLAGSAGLRLIYDRNAVKVLPIGIQ